MPIKRTAVSIGMLAGATIGAGVFTLPYVASLVGLVPFIGYLIVLGTFVAGVHYLYWKALNKTGATHSLVGLCRQFLGVRFERLALVAIILGLVFTLSIYILLGGRFLSRVFPLPVEAASVVFWLAVSVPLAFSLRRFVRVELVVTVLMVAAALALVFTEPLAWNVLPTPPFADLFFPFGPLLFALAGWTAIEPMVARYRQALPLRRTPVTAFALGTAGIALVYLLFVVGIANVSTTVTPDAFAGLGTVPPWYLVLLFVFGLCAIVTSYLPMSLEIKHSLVGDLRWPRSLAVPTIMFLPYVFILAGLDNFIVLIELVGGVFLAVQYLLILFVSRRILDVRGIRRVGLDVVAGVFFLAIAYQFYYLLV